MTIEELADRPIVFFDVGSSDRDPTRRQFVERAQEVGIVLTPRIEVETLVMALRLVAMGLGDTYLPRAHAAGWHFPPGLSTTSFDPPLFDTLALVTRKGAQLSPAMQLFVTHVEAHLANVGAELQATRGRFTAGSRGRARCPTADSPRGRDRSGRRGHASRP